MYKCNLFRKIYANLATVFILIMVAGSFSVPLCQRSSPVDKQRTPHPKGYQAYA